MPEPIRLLAQTYALDLAPAATIEQAQLDRLCMLGQEREVDAFAVPRRSLRIRSTRPDRVDQIHIERRLIMSRRSPRQGAKRMSQLDRDAIHDAQKRETPSRRVRSSCACCAARLRYSDDSRSAVTSPVPRRTCSLCNVLPTRPGVPRSLHPQDGTRTTRNRSTLCSSTSREKSMEGSRV